MLSYKSQKLIKLFLGLFLVTCTCFSQQVLVLDSGEILETSDGTTLSTIADIGNIPVNSVGVNVFLTPNQTHYCYASNGVYTISIDESKTVSNRCNGIILELTVFTNSTSIVWPSNVVWMDSGTSNNYPILESGYTYDVFFDKKIDGEKWRACVGEGSIAESYKRDRILPSQYLIAGYQLNGDSSDMSGNNNHGTASSLTYTSDMSRDRVVAIFNGSSSFVNCNSAIIPSSNLTVCAWIFRPNSSNSQIIVGQYLSGQVGRFLFRHTANDSLGIQIGGTGNSSTNMLHQNLWDHVAITRQDSSTKLYINGISVNTTFIPDPTYTGINTEIGRGNASGTHFLGRMSDVFFFNKALSSNDIVRVMNNQNPTYE